MKQCSCVETAAALVIVERCDSQVFGFYRGRVGLRYNPGSTLYLPHTSLESQRSTKPASYSELSLCRFSIHYPPAVRSILLRPVVPICFHVGRQSKVYESRHYCTSPKSTVPLPDYPPRLVRSRACGRPRAPSPPVKRYVARRLFTAHGDCPAKQIISNRAVILALTAIEFVL